MNGWVGVVGANDNFELTEHATGFFLVFAKHGEGANALAIQAETLAERGGNQEVQAGFDKLANHRAVFSYAVAKALVGHVEEGGQVLGFDCGNDLAPLGGGDVVAGGVMAAGVQNHNGAGGGRVQVGQHAGKIDTALGGVVVAVALHGEAGVGEKGAVVFPARVRNQHLGVGVEAFQEVGANFQTAGATNALNRGHAARLDWLAVGTKHQAFDRSVIGGNAVNGQVAACRGLFHHGFFGFLHAFQQRQFAVVVKVDAHAQVDFGRVGVGGKLLVQAQNGVAWGHFHGGKE